jgi:hypothetical protein
VKRTEGKKNVHFVKNQINKAQLIVILELLMTLCGQPGMARVARDGRPQGVKYGWD